MSPRTRLRAVSPLLVVSDLQRSLDFYCGPLGFRDPNVHGEPPCFALLQRDGFQLMLSLADARASVRPNSPGGPGGTWDLYLTVVDVAAECAALEASGVRLDRGPSDAPYEMREVELLDPDGYRLCLAQDLSRGPWPHTVFYEGALELGARSLRLVLKLAEVESGPVGCLDSPDQALTNLPIEHIERDGAALRFELRTIGASFAGKFDAERSELTGQWSQAGQSWPLGFHRV